MESSTERTIPAATLRQNFFAVGKRRLLVFPPRCLPSHEPSPSRPSRVPARLARGLGHLHTRRPGILCASLGHAGDRRRNLLGGLRLLLRPRLSTTRLAQPRLGS